MPASPQLALPIEAADQVGDARRQAQRLAQAAGLGEADQQAAALVATELATNLCKHARGGELLLQGRADGGGMLELLAVDLGPGIADVERCLADGYSTSGTLGTGLGAVRRLAREFDLYSPPGSGTAVVARIGPRPPSATPPLRWGAVNLPIAGETVSGDVWQLRVDGDEVAVMVADGLGHGPLAHAAASAAAAVFLAGPLTPVAFVERAHAALGATRGAALAMARVLPTAGRVDYAGIGNIAGSIVTASGSQGLVSHPGTVGKEMRRPHAFHYEWPDAGVLVMHSDGLETRWQSAVTPALLQRHPSLLAARLYRDHRRGRDDVTVVVLELRSRPRG